jgi:hypothetical protein
LLVVACVCALAGSAASQAPGATATVDFAAPRTVRSASGLLFGTFTTTPASRLVPLRPRVWRFADYYTSATGYVSWIQAAQAFHAVLPDVENNFLLAQSWGFPVGNWNGIHQPPWGNWTAYETHLRDLVRTIASAGLDGTWEIWNEPDIPDFWNGTRDQFHELYRRAYWVVRSELGPGANIGGPSFGVYSHAAIEAFLEYCLANGCEVNTLIFHANDDTPAGMAAFPADVRDARTSFLQNPRYAALRMTRILTNEIGGPPYTHQPAGTLARYAAFEDSGADGAARSCWFDSAGAAECFNGTMDGLVTAGAWQPRGVWWAHKLYADGVESRVAATVSGANLTALASRGTGAEPAQVLVGHVDFQRTINRQPGRLIARLVMRNIRALAGFNRAGRVAVQIESIPDTGEAALAAPVALPPAQVDLVAGTATIDLPPMQVGQALRLTLQPLDGGVPDAPQAFVASVANSAVSLRWEVPPSGPLPSAYLLEAGSRPDTADLLVQPLGNVTRFDAVAPRGTYYVRLRAINASGPSDPTASQRLDVGCMAAPGPPLGLRGAVTGSLVNLMWERGAGVADRHLVEAGSGSGQSNLAVVPVPSPTTALQAAAPAGTYFIRVRAANDCGTSAPSSEIFLTVGATGALPGAPGTPAATVNGSTVSLTWSAPATGDPATAYRLEAGTSPGLGNAAIVTLGSTPSFATSGVPPGTYYVRVRAINQAGVGPASDDVTVLVP